ncbi:putative aspartic-type endopeptidase opsB [Beauveria bassiana]|nr:putative aspartic-type endopeptidase opsB [Beauveria bassiana]
MFSDEVSLGGKSLGQLAFGIGNMTSPHTTLGRTIGVMGLLPAPPHSKDSTDFVPQMLLDKKITKTRAFGMALRENGQGLLTFGGYDTSKFSGPLEKLPILPNKWRHSIVSIQSVSFKASSCGSSEVVLNKETASRDLTMCIDSGSPALVLKKDLFEIVEAKLQAKPSSGPLKVACDVVDAGASLDFRLTNSTRVSVPLSDMLLQKVDSGKNCILAIRKSRVPSDLFIGGHFFRRSFVLHDPDDNSIYVGRGADCGSSVVAIDGKMPTDVIKGKCSEEPAAAEKPSASAMDSIAGLTVEELTALIDPRIHKDEA